MKSIPTWTHKVLLNNFDVQKNSLENKIALAIMAYAAGDALGVQYEFIKEKPVITRLSIQEKEGWPFGGVSDDTLLSLITMSSLEEENPDLAANLFLERLKTAVPKLRGLGPTTREALGLKVSDHEVKQVGNTNGAMMRTALCGMAFKPSDAERRSKWILKSASMTHQNPNATFSAVLLSGIVSELTDNFASREIDVYEIAIKVLNELDSRPERLDSELKNFGKWSPPANGISLDPIETLLAVIWVVKGAKSFENLYIRACQLGGDTDTVAALSSAVYALKAGEMEQFLAMQWLSDIKWDEVGNLENMIYLVAKNRGK